jgi:phosphoglycerate dehydrogenase-like enzyme
MQAMNVKDKLLILSRNSNRYHELIRKQAFDNLDLVVCDRADVPPKHLGDCNMILGETELVAEVVDAASQLQWVQTTFAGVEALMRPGIRKDYLLTNVKGVFGPMMSVYVSGYIIALERHFFETFKNQRKRLWHRQPYRSLAEVTLGVCGVGSIGRHVAATAKHFGMAVWGYRKSDCAVPEVDHMFTESNFYAFLSKPDYIVVTLPHTPETLNLFDQDAFCAMHNSAVLINIGRGAVVSEAALIRALEAGTIRGAVLDVFEKEPLPADSPLWMMDGVWITPHNSGYSYAESIVTIFSENYRRFKAGQPLRYRVDFDRGY